MKIGIVTIQKCDNFGADLQAYALQRKLRLMGYDAENVDYLYYKHPRHRGGKGERPIFRLSPVNRVKEALFPLLAWLKSLKRRKAMKTRRAKFAAWTDRHLTCGAEYRSVASLYADPPRYDVYMVGSDQVWNPRTGSSVLPYFLDFAPDGAKCVSYAASFGVGELPAGVFYRYRQLLRRFSAIGLREESGADMVRAMALGVEVKHVVDPTLLLTPAEWAEVSCEAAGTGGGYILLYDLKESPETVALARRWAKALGVKVLRVGDLPIGPGEFVGLVARAEAVVTTSFHGTAFAVNHARPFVSVIPRGMDNASRIESLLKSLGLTDRLVKAADAEAFDVSREVPFDEALPRLEALRADSAAFLKRAVDEPAQKVSHRLPLGCYAVWNADDAVRAASTSGGLFRILAERTIAQGGVVYGAAFAPDFRTVVHRAAETMEALDPLMKSKYVWSDPTAAYRQAVRNLKDGRAVLFAGTPCQVAAMKSLAKGVDGKLVTVDIVCHGTPRPEIFAAYVKELERRFGGKVTRYEFRNKDAGWNFPHVKAEFSNGGGGYDMILRNDPYYLGFGINATLRPGCFCCPYTNLERVSDFTVGDCWRVASSHPEWDDDKGTSLVLVNTPKAVEIWDGILKVGRLKGGEYDLGLAQMRNGPLMQKARKPACYDRFQEAFGRTGSFGEAAKTFLSFKFVFRATLVYWVKKLGWFYFRRHQ